MSSLSRRRLLAFGITPAFLTAIAGCRLAEPLEEQTVSFTAPHVERKALDVESHNGAITIVQDDTSEIQIVATLRMTSQERLGQTSVSATRDASSTLIVRADPPGGAWQSREGVAFQITVPQAIGIVARSSNGRIELTGLAGDAQLRTSNGRITVINHDGPVTARTSNGAIRMENIGGPVAAETSNGAISIMLDDENPGPVTLTTSNGAVQLTVGDAFEGELSISTSNGSIRTPENDGDSYETLSKSRGSATLRFGSATSADSRIKTSNGSVSVSR